MLALLPLSVFALLFLSLLGRSALGTGPTPDPRDAFLKAALGWGVAALAIAETLGVLGLLRPLATAGAWLAVAVLVVALPRRLGSPMAGARVLKSMVAGFSVPEPAVSGVASGILFLLFVIAVAAPPNTVDSLLYHMTRVVHWAQSGSLRHYATAYQPQLYMPPWAEIAILHLRLLTGNDRLANLVQWFSLVGCIVGASAVAGKLGASARGQITAGAFTLSLPMAILQGSSTQNDLVVAFWLVTLAYLVLDASARPPGAITPLLFGVTVGLGLATKFTFYVYSLPFVLWWLVSVRGKFGWATAARAAVAVVGVAGLMNLGVWGRNLATYGSPIGPADFRELHQGVLLRPGGLPGVREAIWAEARMMAWNLLPPTGRGKEVLGEMMDRVPFLFGNEFGKGLGGAIWNHEDTAGNPLHLFMVGLTGIAIILARGQGSKGRVGLYALASAAGYVLLPLIVAYASRIDGLRYQLVFFVSWAPVIGWTVSGASRGTLARMASLGLLILCLPWLFLNNTRPLVEARPWLTRVGSVLTSPPQEILFAMHAARQDEFTAVAERIEESGCSDVGIQLDSHDPEYLIWRLLDAPESGVRIEHVATYPILEKYLPESFEPCAVVCTICGDEARFGPLRLDRGYAGIRLYLSTRPGIGP